MIYCYRLLILIVTKTKRHLEYVCMYNILSICVLHMWDYGVSYFQRQDKEKF